MWEHTRLKWLPTRATRSQTLNHLPYAAELSRRATCPFLGAQSGVRREALSTGQGAGSRTSRAIRAMRQPQPTVHATTARA